MWANTCGKWNEGGRQNHRFQLGDCFLRYRTFFLGNDRCLRVSREWCLAVYLRNFHHTQEKCMAGSSSSTWTETNSATFSYVRNQTLHKKAKSVKTTERYSQQASGSSVCRRCPLLCPRLWWWQVRSPAPKQASHDRGGDDQRGTKLTANVFRDASILREKVE